GPRRLVRLVLHVLPDLRARAARVLGRGDQGDAGSATAQEGCMKALNALITKLLEPTQRHHGVLGVFYYVDDVEQTVQALRGMGYREIVVKSPVPHHVIEKALGQGPSLVRWVTACGAFLGATGGFTLCIWSMFSWPLVVGGKELTSLPPFVVIGYESFILIGALSNLVGMLAL